MLKSKKQITVGASVVLNDPRTTETLDLVGSELIWYEIDQLEKYRLVEDDYISRKDIMFLLDKAIEELTR